MARAVIHIKNKALSAIGITTPIAREDEISTEAQETERWYEAALRMTLRAFPWSFATGFERNLTRVDVDLSPEWPFYFLYPTEAVFVRRILPANVQPGVEAQPVPTKEFLSPKSKKLIGTTERNPSGAEITRYVSDVRLFPDDFENALSFRLGAFVASSMKKGKGMKSAEMLMAMFHDVVGQAKSNSSNESLADQSYSQVRGSLIDSRRVFI